MPSSTHLDRRLGQLNGVVLLGRQLVSGPCACGPHGPSTRNERTVGAATRPRQHAHRTAFGSPQSFCGSLPAATCLAKRRGPPPAPHPAFQRPLGRASASVRALVGARCVMRPGHTAGIDDDAVLAANLGSCARAVALANLEHVNVQTRKLCRRVASRRAVSCERGERVAGSWMMTAAGATAAGASACCYRRWTAGRACAVPGY